MPTVRIGRMPGRIRNIELAEGSTINDALGEAGLDPNGYDVRVNGQDTTNLGAEVEDGQDILLVRKIKGNETSWASRLWQAVRSLFTS